MTRRPAPRLVSVVVPALNAAATVGEQLDALAAQDHAGDWELVVADGGSTDATRAIVETRLARFASARLVDASGPPPNLIGLRRNRGAAAARGDFLAFCDADDVVAPGWVSALAEGARHGDLVAGRLDTETLNPPALRLHHDTPGWERHCPVRGFLPTASSANCGVWADAFAALGGFEEGQGVAEDRDLAWRAQLASYRLHRAADAVVAYRYRSGLLAAGRQHYGWGKSNARLYRDFRADGMPRTRTRDALWAWAWSLGTVPALPWSASQRGRWVLRTAQRLGHVVGSVRERVVFL